MPDLPDLCQTCASSYGTTRRTHRKSTKDEAKSQVRTLNFTTARRGRAVVVRWYLQQSFPQHSVNDICRAATLATGHRVRHASCETST